MSSHRAIVRLNETISIVERQTPIPINDEILIAPIYVGLCGTDIQILRGFRNDPSPIIGHEGIARVIAVGNQVSRDIKLGSLVCINPTHRSDPLFLLGHNVEGLLQEKVLIKGTAVQSGLVIPLSEKNNCIVSSLIEPLAVVQYAFSILKDYQPHTLVVIGDGTIGHLAIRIASRFLNYNIKIIHLHHSKQGVLWSKKHSPPSSLYSIKHTSDIEILTSLSKNEIVSVLLATPRDATLSSLEVVIQNIPSDLVIDLIGGLPADASSSLLPNINLSNVRSANCAGLPNPAIHFQAKTNTGKLVTLFGHRGVAHKYFRTAAIELAENPNLYRDLITHFVDLEKAVDIMRYLSTSKDRTIDHHRLIKLVIGVSS